VATTTTHGLTPSAAATPRSNPAALLAAWGSCMRKHGDPNQIDPSIDANNVIHIHWDPSIPGGPFGTNKGGHGNSGPGPYCRSYLNSAQSALQGGNAPARPSLAALEKFSACMRANGIPDFPDLTAGGNLSINRGGGGDLNPSNPAFQRASNVCSKKSGVPGFSGQPTPGTIALD
jgi:hypothetical protein